MKRDNIVVHLLPVAATGRWRLDMADGQERLDATSTSKALLEEFYEAIMLTDEAMQKNIKLAVTASHALRIGDDERNATLEALSAHFQKGRLKQEEYAERMEKALVATIQPELDALLSDLPVIAKVTVTKEQLKAQLQPVITAALKEDLRRELQSATAWRSASAKPFIRNAVFIMTMIFIIAWIIAGLAG